MRSTPVRVLSVLPPTAADQLVADAADDPEPTVDRVSNVDDGRARLAETIYDHVVVSTAVEGALAFAREAADAPSADGVVVTGPETEPTAAAELSRTAGVEYAPRDALAGSDESLSDRLASTATDDRLQRRLVEFVDDGVFATAPDGTFRLVNEAFAALADRDREQLVGRHASEVLRDADVETGRERVLELLDDPDQSSATYRGTVERPDGETVPVEVSLALDHGEAGPPGTVGVVRDLRHRQRRRRRLERYERIVETAPVGVFMIDEDGRIIDHDDDAMEMLGVDDGPYDGRPFSDLVEEGVFDPELLEEYLDLVRELLSSSNDRTSGVLDVETTVDGERRLFEAHVGLLPYDESFNGVAGVLHDVTERRRSENQLASERAFVDSLLNTLPDLFYVLDEHGAFARWNERLPEVSGYDDDELAEMHATELVPPEDREEIASAMADVYGEGTAQHRESAVLTADGRRIPHLFSGNRIEDHDGSVRGLVGTARDITEQKRREQRLAVLRRVLRHNIRQEVTMLRGAAERIAGAATDPDAAAAGETVRKVGARLDDLSETARLIEDAIDRGPVSSGATVDAETVVSEVVDRFERADADFRTAIETETAVRADDRLATALEQLVENAVEHGAGPAADGSNGSPTVTVGCRRTGDEVEFFVCDDGPGIDEAEVVAADEDPEITQLDHGSGLGLWLVRWVTRAMDGTFEVAPRDDGGTAARLRLPVGG